MNRKITNFLFVAVLVMVNSGCTLRYMGSRMVEDFIDICSSDIKLTYKIKPLSDTLTMECVFDTGKNLEAE